MAAIIKNQILKHLSRFVKNLSSDKINVSTLKGEGELKNLQLEEEVLTELLALPTWMKLTYAHCDRASIRIPWTKLRSVPILLSLDSVTITVEATEELRSFDNTANVQAFAASGKYGFVNKVIDGITVVVNSVEILFRSKAFETNFQINRIRVESRSPRWTQAELQHTRLKCLDRGETLIFKAMDWQSMRLEARSTSDRSLAPLRLLTNQAKAHIVIKKRLNDCQVLGCRLTLMLDELLWVLTDSQIVAALHFMNSISGLIKQATEVTQKYKAARKLESLPEYQAQQTQTAQQKEKNQFNPFDEFDVKETSYHFNCKKIDLHFCDDTGAGRSNHEDLKEGGALQLSLIQMNVDFYPYHLARGDRKYWPKYTSDNELARWLSQALNSFRIALIEAVSCDSMHTPLTRNHPIVETESNSLVKKKVMEMFGKLMSTCLVLRIQDLVLYKVTTSSKRSAPEPFICSYMDRPRDLPTIHVEFTWCFYPGDICFPVPSPKIYAYMFPIQVNLDTCTVLWLNCFAANLQNSIPPVETSEPDYVDVRLELMMPKVVFENKMFPSVHRERPLALQIQVSRVVLSNVRSQTTGSLTQLAQCLDTLQRGDLAYGVSFPAKSGDVPLVSEKFIKHAQGTDRVREIVKTNSTSFHEIAPYLTKDMLNVEARDMMYVHLDQVWADFLVGSSLAKSDLNTSNRRQSNRQVPTHKLLPFLDAIPISLWMHVKENEIPSSSGGVSKQKSIQVLFSASERVNVQMSHYQYLFLMRMVEAIGEISVYLTYDLEKIVGEKIHQNLLTVIGYLPRIEANFVFTPKKEEQRDVQSDELDFSLNPESSGIGEELQAVNEEESWKTQSENLPNIPVVVKPDSLDVPNFAVSSGNSPVHSSSFATDTYRHMKQGMSSLVVSFNKNTAGISTPDSEVASLSNFSSGSSENNFIQIDSMGTDAYVDNGIEVAYEVVEDNRSTPSPSMFVDQTDRGIGLENNNTVQVLAVALDHVEIAQEARGLTTVQKVQCRSVVLNECPDMTYREFQAQFASKLRSSKEDSVRDLGSPSQPRVVKARLTQRIDVKTLAEILESKNVRTIIANIKNPANPRLNLCDRPGAESPMRQAVIDATVMALEAQVDLSDQAPIVLHMSNVMSLADLVEDEIVPTPFPIQIELMGASVELIEDRPPANDTSPGSLPPVKVAITNPLHILRDKHGVVHVGSKAQNEVKSRLSEATCNDNCAAKRHSEMEFKTLVSDFEKTKKQLESAHVRNSDLEQQLKDTESLKLMVLDLQEQVKKLQEEKFRLLQYNAK